MSIYEGGEIFFRIDDSGNIKGMSDIKHACLEKSKAYKRNDTATIEVDTLEFSRLILEGKNIRFEASPYKEQDLTLEVLHQKLKESIQIETFNQDIYIDYYQYEEIQGADRKKIEKIPEAAFREAIANALIHRMWDVKSQIRVLMYDDRIEVISPGGFCAGLSERAYTSFGEYY